MNTLTKFASFVLSAAFLAASMNLCAAEKTIKLPPPDKAGGKPLMQCLTERKSERKFDSKPLPPQILSDLLYAADGISRPDGRIYGVCQLFPYCHLGLCCFFPLCCPSIFSST